LAHPDSAKITITALMQRTGHFRLLICLVLIFAEAGFRVFTWACVMPPGTIGVLSTIVMNLRSAGSAVAATAVPSHAAMPRETVSDIRRETVSTEAVSDMLRKMLATMCVAETVVVVEVVEGAKTEVERIVDLIVSVSAISVVGVGIRIPGRAVTRHSRARRNDKPDTQQERHCLHKSNAALHCSLHRYRGG
jgi:hypothetical protein